MADTSGMAEIRGLNVDKLAKGFADEKLTLRGFLAAGKTNHTEIRWYKKTAGFLDTPDTTGITASGIYNTSSKSRPQVVEQSWTRTSSYVKKYFVESPLFSDEDLKDSDMDLFGTNLRDLVRAVQKQVDIRCYNVLTEGLSPSTINSGGAAGTGWSDGTNGNPIADILSAKNTIKAYNYEPNGAVLYINPAQERDLLSWLISTKGSSIPAYASEKVRDGEVMNLLGVKIVSQNSATATYGLMFVPKVAATWKSFTPLQTAVIHEPGIGKKVRIWEEGEAILHDPRAVNLMTGL